MCGTFTLHALSLLSAACLAAICYARWYYWFFQPVAAPSAPSSASAAYRGKPGSTGVRSMLLSLGSYPNLISKQRDWAGSYVFSGSLYCFLYVFSCILSYCSGKLRRKNCYNLDWNSPVFTCCRMSTWQPSTLISNWTKHKAAADIVLQLPPRKDGAGAGTVAQNTYEEGEIFSSIQLWIPSN